jgi:hypothetical protein
MFARWDLKKSENLTYNFNVRNGFNDVNALVEGYVLRILALRVEIHNWKTHLTSHRLNYSKYNLYNFTTIFEE